MLVQNYLFNLDIEFKKIATFFFKDTIDSPFTLNDVTSRSALMGVRSLGRTSRKNPNETKERAKSGRKK